MVIRVQDVHDRWESKDSRSRILNFWETVIQQSDFMNDPSYRIIIRVKKWENVRDYLAKLALWCYTNERLGKFVECSGSYYIEIDGRSYLVIQHDTDLTSQIGDIEFELEHYITYGNHHNRWD